MHTLLIVDSGSTKTHWALVLQHPGLPRVVRMASTMGLNPLYVTSAQIAQALRDAMAEVECACPDQVIFYGSGCSGQRVAEVEQALRSALTPMTRVQVHSDLLGAALALNSTLDSSEPQHTQPFISCIMGTGSIAALYQPSQRQLTPMPALGYILGDEGSGAWFGRQLVSDYLKHQMPAAAVQAFEDDFGPLRAESVIQHVYQLPQPNRYLATFAAFLGRHLHLRYAQELAFRGVDQFWRRNILPIASLDEGDDVYDVRLVGSVAYHLSDIIHQVAASHDYCVTRIIKDPIEGLISCSY